MKPTLRPAVSSDVPVLSPLIERSARALSAGFYSPAQIESAIRHVFGVDSTLIADGTYFVALDGDVIVGCGGWSRRRRLYGGDQRPVGARVRRHASRALEPAGEPAMETGDTYAAGPDSHPHPAEPDSDTLDPAKDAARVRAFFIDPAHARRGIGRMILDACEHAARAAGFQRLELMATLPGIPLYAACGFREAGRITDVLPDGTAIDFVRMEKPLP